MRITKHLHLCMNIQKAVCCEIEAQKHETLAWLPHSTFKVSWVYCRHSILGKLCATALVTGNFSGSCDESEAAYCFSVEGSVWFVHELNHWYCAAYQRGNNLNFSESELELSCLYKIPWLSFPPQNERHVKFSNDYLTPESRAPWRHLDKKMSKQHDEHLLTWYKLN